jgi:hypothetical protein
LSNRYGEITNAGGRVVAVTVDPPPQNAAMIEKLRLPFPILSDPDRSLAVEPYGVADPKDPRNIARPSIFIVAPDHELVFGEVSDDFADRAAEEGVVATLQDLGLPSTTPEMIQAGPAEPGPRAMPLHAMEPYFRGAKFAVTAMKLRHPEVEEDAAIYIAQMDRYIELVKELRGKS